MNEFQLAQINIALAKSDLESELMKGFVDRLAEINKLADESDGFVWRLQTDNGDATSIQAFDDPRVIVNMSVWRDVESLMSFVYRTAHVELLRDRKRWFEPAKEASQAMWWIRAGEFPSVEQGKEKLRHIDANGSGERAFTFARVFEPPRSE